MLETFTLLLVEDERIELERLERVFQRLNLGCKILKAATPAAALNQFRRLKPEVVILDLGLSGSGPAAGVELIARMISLDPTSRIVVLTGYASEEVGIQAIRSGAASFLTKPANNLMLETLVRDYAQTAKFRRNALAPNEIAPLPGFIGNSPAMQNVYRLIRQCAATEANVLIVGETGTGKELVSHAIHNLSARREGPFAVYFGSAPGSLAESELFGYVRGAFTGASREGADGCIRRADHGTLFIDELCSLDADIQRKLLRAVEEKTFKPLGSDSYIKSDFRLVSAAQPRIYDFVRSGQFREDLLSRVEVITIALPPLRERREDILPLAEHFQKDVKEELVRSGLPSQVWGFTKDVVQAFREYSWPRNLRQLKHTVHNGVIQAQLRGSERVGIEDVLSRLEEAGNEEKTVSSFRPGVTLHDAVSKLEREIIVESLRRHDSNFSQVSKELGVGRTTLWRKLKEYGVKTD